MNHIRETYNLLAIFDYTKSEIEYGLCKTLENHPEYKSDESMLMTWSITYIERDIKRNPKYL